MGCGVWRSQAERQDIVMVSLIGHACEDGSGGENGVVVVMVVQAV